MGVRYKIELNPRYEHLRRFVESIPCRNESLGEVIYRARNVVTDITADGVRLCIKSFKIPPLYNRIAYTYLRRSKARRSFENAIRLLDVGVSTPTPVAYIEVYRSGLLERSYYVSLMLDAVHVRDWQLRPDATRISNALASMLLRLHREGIWHRDFSPGNVIYDKDYNFYLIDINRMQFGKVSPRQVALNFMRLNRDEAATEQLVRTYAALAAITDPEPLVAKALKLSRRFWNNIRRKDERKARREARKKQ